MPTRRAFVGLSALSLACRRGPAPNHFTRDLSYGPSPSQRFDIYGVSAQPGVRAPLAILIHGGGWESGARSDVAGFVATLTARSYAVANIDYRLADEAKAPAAAEDVRKAIEWIRARAATWDADANRMLLVGFSAGAHLALLSALAPDGVIAGPQSHPRAIVSFWGPTDVVDLLEGENARDFAQRWLGEGPEQLELAHRLSPINYDVTRAPALCAVHSVHDDVVPFAQSERMVAKFQKANRPAKLIRLAHAGHAAPAGDYPAIFERVFGFVDGLKIVS